MKFPDNAKCICGHVKKDHASFRPACFSCNTNFYQHYWEHDFKLDNLKLIEDLAKEKKLV